MKQVAAVIVPGLAVSTDGIRLGRGGGSYDRALARVGPDVPIVALLRDGEFGVQVPAEPHDRAVTGVITPAKGCCYLRVVEIAADSEASRRNRRVGGQCRGSRGVCHTRRRDGISTPRVDC